jgi:hypothetical protein
MRNFKRRNPNYKNTSDKPLSVTHQKFIYDGSSIEFTTTSPIDSVISLDINGLHQEETINYEVSDTNKIKLLGIPFIGAKIGVVYLS